MGLTRRALDRSLHAKGKGAHMLRETVLPLAQRSNVPLCVQVLRAAARAANPSEWVSIIQREDRLHVVNVSEDELRVGLDLAATEWQAQARSIEDTAALGAHDEVVLDKAFWWKWENLQQQIDQARALRQAAALAQ